MPSPYDTDLDKAKDLFAQAAAQGHQQAVENLERIQEVETEIEGQEVGDEANDTPAVAVN